jgi:phosphatidylethanolamine-binding protein (PEBP) family uncharacterized protein
MTLLGTLLKNRRAGETHLAWNLQNLQAPELLSVTSQHFDEGEPIPLRHAGKRIGGDDLSPDLTWSPPPPETTELLLVIEDIDAPLIPKPAVHCLALIDPSRLDASSLHLPAGALSANDPAAGVRVLRSTVGRGYHGPEPMKGHGPHRYTFQLFALCTRADTIFDRTAADRARPRVFLASITAPVVARGRLTGVFER